MTFAATIYVSSDSYGPGSTFAAEGKTEVAAVLAAAAGLVDALDGDGSLLQRAQESERLREWLADAQTRQVLTEQRAASLAEDLAEMLEAPSPLAENRARESLRLYRARREAR